MVESVASCMLFNISKELQILDLTLLKQFLIKCKLRGFGVQKKCLCFQTKIFQRVFFTKSCIIEVGHLLKPDKL